MVNTPKAIKGLTLKAANTRTGQTSEMYFALDSSGNLPRNSVERLMTWGMQLYAGGWDREEVSITGLEDSAFTLKFEKPAQ